MVGASPPSRTASVVPPAAPRHRTRPDWNCRAVPVRQSTTCCPETAAMPNTPPDRLSNNPKSPFYDAELLERGIGIRFKGVEKNNVEEYCVSEGWVRLA